MEPYFENGSGLTLLKIGEKDFILRTTVGTGIQLKLKTKSVSFFLRRALNTYFMIFTIHESELLISEPVPLKIFLNALIYNFEGLVNGIL